MIDGVGTTRYEESSDEERRKEMHLHQFFFYAGLPLGKWAQKILFEKCR